MRTDSQVEPGAGNGVCEAPGWQGSFSSWHQCVAIHAWNIANPKSSPKFWCLEFLLRLHYVHRIGRIFV